MTWTSGATLATLLVIVLIACDGGGGNPDPLGPDDPPDPPATPVASVSLSRSTLMLLVGEQQQLIATARDLAGNVLFGRPVSWVSTQPSLASVSETGLVTGVQFGAAIVTATVEGKNASVAVSVAEPIESITISPATLQLLYGETQQLTATATDRFGNVLTGRSLVWTSSNSGAAGVSGSGIVSGRGAGEATITVTSGGKSGSAEVTVAFAVVSYTQVVTGGAHTCGLATTGKTFCWGRGESGQLGVPTPPATCTIDGQVFSCSMAPIPIGGPVEFTTLTAGGAHTCGLTSDGAAYCWGNNGAGQLGDNSTTSRTAPVPVSTGLRFARIDAGGQNTCAVTSAGVAYCWGRNHRGQLGDGTLTNRSLPSPVAGGHTFEVVDAGGFAAATGVSTGHTCGLTSSGAAYCWGENSNGQVGVIVTTDHYAVPVAVEGQLVFTALTVGLGGHTCALSETGAAYCWGANPFGALGDGQSGGNRWTPGPVLGGHFFSQLVAGGFLGHTCGVTAGGAAYCWGDNEVGQVGDGTRTDAVRPVAVTGGHAFTRLDAGFRHTCGPTTSGTVYCWGSNGAGQLGLNSTSSSDVPGRVVGQP